MTDAASRSNATRGFVRPDVAAGAFLFICYCATVARGMTYWDAGEFLAAIHSLGIPHPPGTALYVLVARVWSSGLAPLVGFTLAVNLFSAACTALAFALVANLFWRWTNNWLGAFAAALVGGGMSTVWLNATEAEVYAAALALGMILLVTCDRAGRRRNAALVVLAMYLAGLAWALHLTALLTIPAGIALVLAGGWRPRVSAIALGFAFTLVGASAVLFMLVRARHDPFVNQANPLNWTALVYAVQRQQYDVAPMWPRRAPLWLQLGNIFEYADWQIALGLSPEPPPSLARTTLTVVYAALGAYGAVRHRVRDRRSWLAWLVLLVVTSLGVVVYLNSYAGASYGVGVLPANAKHEARDRDYFYAWAFLAWGAWAGFGISELASAAAARWNHRARWLCIGTIAALVPLACNWSVVREMRFADQRQAVRETLQILDSLPPRAVMIAIGDNDTYPIWYMQEVAGRRRDITVVTVPLLSPPWYRDEMRRRFGLLDSAHVAAWYGPNATLANMRERAAAQGRPVVMSPLAFQRN